MTNIEKKLLHIPFICLSSPTYGLYIVDRENGKIYITDSHGQLISSLGETGVRDGQFLSPTVIGFLQIYVAWLTTII